MQPAHDPGGHRLAHIHRVANGQHHVADLDLARIAIWNRGEMVGWDLNDGEVEIGIGADAGSLQEAAVGERDRDVVGVLDDVIVGQDQALVGVIDDARADFVNLAGLALFFLPVLATTGTRPRISIFTTAGVIFLRIGASDGFALSAPPAGSASCAEQGIAAIRAPRNSAAKIVRIKPYRFPRSRITPRTRLLTATSPSFDDFGRSGNQGAG